MKPVLRSYSYFIFFIFLGLAPIRSEAFPEFVKHGYVSCAVCHVSPDGGGVLTEYGRALSTEVLSTWGTEEEAQFFWNAIRPPDWLQLGGDLRAVQVYQNNPRFEQARFIMMQADIEAAVNLKQWVGVVTVGRQELPSKDQFIDRVFSRRHYLQYLPTENLSFRLGKFRLAYGLNVPDHIITIKRGLEWDYDTEAYHLESAWMGENLEIFLTGSIGRPDDRALDRDTGGALRASYSLEDSYKPGISFYHGENDSKKRTVFGIWGILGFSPQWVLLTETDYQFSTPTGSTETQKGVFSYHRLDYEFIQGLHAQAIWEFSQSNLDLDQSFYTAIGLGVQFFPRPHFDIQGVFQKQKTELISQEYEDYAYLSLHLYL